MSDFDTDVSTSTVTDLSKRVRYSTGLVLGVDEFEQDQAYFIERDRLLTRALHGYGVVQGLPVDTETSEDAAEGPAEAAKLQVKVGPGLAVTPNGQHVCVERAQCAVIEDWLAEQSTDLIGGVSGPTELCLSVVLRYGTCATDFVPIPSGPCRSAEESRAASRLADDFHLALVPENQRPPHYEERAVRLLGKLLRALEVRPGQPFAEASDVKQLVKSVPDVVQGGDDLTLAALKNRAESNGEDDSSEPPPVEGIVLPEDGEPVVRIASGTETEALRAIEEAWVTHARREVLRTGHTDDALNAGKGPEGRCQPAPKGDDGVLLGTLCLQVKSTNNGGLQLVEEQGRPQPETNDRPHLLSTRVLQETGFFDRVRPADTDGGSGGMEDTTLKGEPALGDLAGTYPDPRVKGLKGTPITDLEDYPFREGSVLQLRGEEWRPVAPDELIEGDLEDTTLAGTDAGGDLREEYPDPRVKGLQGTPITNPEDDPFREGSVLQVQDGMWRPVDPQVLIDLDPDDVLLDGTNAGGDLREQYPDPRVVGLQTTSIADLRERPPEEGEVLAWNGAEWSPITPAELDLPTPPGPEPEPEPEPEPTPTNAEPGLTRIVATSWMHGHDYASQNELRIPFEEGEKALPGLAVVFGKEKVTEATRLGIDESGLVKAQTLTQEVFRVFIEVVLPRSVPPDRQLTDRNYAYSGLTQQFRIVPRDIIPLRTVDLVERSDPNEGLEIRSATAGRSEENEARGMAFPLPSRLSSVFPSKQFQNISDVRLEIEVRGDFILDEQERAIDAEFVREELPTGDRPRPSEQEVEAGVQGGRFESWIYTPINTETESSPERPGGSTSESPSEEPSEEGTEEQPEGTEASESVMEGLENILSEFGSGMTRPTMRGETGTPEGSLVDLNNTTKEELKEKLPDVGDVTARKINEFIEKRHEEGKKIEHISELTEIPQVTERKVQKWKDKIINLPPQ